MDSHTAQFEMMTTQPLRPLILRMALPCIISMLVSTFYNMADTFFVGQLDSTAATGAVGVVFSLMGFLQAIGFFFGQGSGNCIARSLGQQDRQQAQEIAATGFFSALFLGVFISFSGLLLLQPLALLLGSTPTILPYTLVYLRIILVGAPWLLGSFVLNQQLRFQGRSTYAMVGITTGTVLNLLLDPLLILVLNWGIAGAGWATVISQCVSFFILLSGYFRASPFPLRLRSFRWQQTILRQIFQGGLPSLIRQTLASLSIVCLNHAAFPLGDSVIAAMGIVQRISLFGISVMLGFGQGFQPVCGFNFGAGKLERAKEGFRFCIRFAFLFLTAVALAGFCFAPVLVALFRDDPKVIAVGTAALRTICFTFPLQSWVVMSNMMQQAVNRPAAATFLSLTRQGIFFIPSVLLFPLYWGLSGLILAQPVSDLLAFLCAVPVQLHILRTLDRGRVSAETTS